MTSYTTRSLALLVALAVGGCGTVIERNEIRKAVKDGSESVEDRMSQLRRDDKLRGAVVREIDGVWLGGKTVKVSRDAELPAVFNQPIRFAFPDRPTLTVIGDRISKIVGLSVRVTPDALIPIEAFSAQRMGGISGLGATSASGSGVAAANGVSLPSNISMNGPIGQSAPNMSMLSGGYQSFQPTRSFIIDQASPFGGTLTELLDQVSSKYGVGWDYKDGAILISRLVTRTYEVATITDTNDVTSTIAKTASSGGSSSGSSGGTGEMGQAGEVSSSADVSAKMSAQVNVVASLKTAIEGH
ncbi:hypothetical protein DZC31_30120 (plasmid) [Stenotrophomonas rhizophila]|nr:hypothetical protein DZC31_30120 [Stenotrophomonas rhizophila]